MNLNARPVVESPVHVGVVLYARHVHKPVQDAELQLQFNAIDECLIRRLQVVEVGVLEDQDRDAEENGNNID